MKPIDADAFGLLGAVALLFAGLAAVYGWQAGLVFTLFFVLTGLYRSWRRI